VTQTTGTCGHFVPKSRRVWGGSPTSKMQSVATPALLAVSCVPPKGNKKSRFNFDKNRKNALTNFDVVHIITLKLIDVR
jgi:hypothetical protein